jgi:RNA polymerase sigma-70 factor, ECF subfamily
VTAIAVESERALVRALRSGDEAAFVDLIERYSPSLLRVASSYVRSRAVAEEVVQEAWLGVLRGIERFEGRSSLKTWIFRIAVNVAKTRAAHEARSLPFSALGDESMVDPERFVEGRWTTPPTSFERLEQRDAVRCIEATIAGLPKHQRQVITLRDVCGLSSTEVCDLLDLTPENQRVLLHRARAKACAALEQLELDGRRAGRADGRPEPRVAAEAVRSPLLPPPYTAYCERKP